MRQTVTMMSTRIPLLHGFKKCFNRGSPEKSINYLQFLDDNYKKKITKSVLNKFFHFSLGMLCKLLVFLDLEFNDFLLKIERFILLNKLNKIK